MTATYLPMTDADRVELAYVAAVLVRVADTPSVPPGAATSAFEGVVNLASLQVTAQDAPAGADPEWLLNAALAALGRLTPSVAADVSVAAVRDACTVALREVHG